jgi:hypothetical protein
MDDKKFQEAKRKYAAKPKVSQGSSTKTTPKHTPVISLTQSDDSADVAALLGLDDP